MGSEGGPRRSAPTAPGSHLPGARVRSTTATLGPGRGREAVEGRARAPVTEGQRPQAGTRRESGGHRQP